MPAITTRRLVAVLKKVPEKRFRIMDLAPQLVDDKGNVDIVRAIDLQGELNLAIAEVDSYIKGTRAASQALSYVASSRAERAGGLDDEDRIVEDEE